MLEGTEHSRSEKSRQMMHTYYDARISPTSSCHESKQPHQHKPCIAADSAEGEWRGGSMKGNRGASKSHQTWCHKCPEKQQSFISSFLFSKQKSPTVSPRHFFCLWFTYYNSWGHLAEFYNRCILPLFPVQTLSTWCKGKRKAIKTPSQMPRTHVPSLQSEDQTWGSFPRGKKSVMRAVSLKQGLHKQQSAQSANVLRHDKPMQHLLLILLLFCVRRIFERKFIFTSCWVLTLMWGSFYLHKCLSFC